MSSKKTKVHPKTKKEPIVFDPHAPPPFPVNSIDLTKPIVISDFSNKSVPKPFVLLSFVVFLAATAGVSFLAGATYNKSKKLNEANVTTPSPTSIAQIIPSSSPFALQTNSPTPSPVLQIKTLGSDPLIDGYQSGSGEGNAGFELRAGRNVKAGTRGFVSFDISNIPSGATIERATIKLYQTSTIGSPYSAMGNLYIDQINYGPTFENSDYRVPIVNSATFVLTTNGITEWKSLDITKLFQNALVSSLDRLQFRLRFEKDTSGGSVDGDFAYFESADNSGHNGNTPQLVVIYH